MLWLALVADLAAQQQAGERNEVADASGIAEGRLLGPLGEPMIAVEVRAALWPDLDTTIARGRTDGSGYFVLSRLPLQTVWLFATAPGHTVGLGFARLSHEQTSAGANLRLWPASAIRGRVVDADGAPIADAIVLGTKDFTRFDGSFRSPEAHTDADGRFELQGVPIGDQIVRAWKNGFVLREQPLFATADSEITVQLERGTGVQLRVHAAGVTAESAAGVKVRMYAAYGYDGIELPDELEHGHLDRDANWSLDGMPDRDWHFALSAPDYAFEPREMRIAHGESPHEVLFSATRQGQVHLHGTLRSASGERLADETILCESIQGDRASSGTTDAKGDFAIAAPLFLGEKFTLRLVGSRYVLLQEKTEGLPLLRDPRNLIRHEGSADPQQDLGLVAVPALRVRGRVVAADGVPVPFRWCELQIYRDGLWRLMAHATSARDGSLAFPGVHRVDDELRIEVTGLTGTACSAPFTAKPGGDVFAEVEIPRLGRIQGRVLGGDGKPMIGTRVGIQSHYLDSGQPIGSTWNEVMTDGDGRYAFVGVAPVGHKIEVLRGAVHLCRSDLIGVQEGETVQFDIRVPAGAGKK